MTKEEQNYRISIYVFNSKHDNTMDDVELIADALHGKYKEDLIDSEGGLRYMITASEIELPMSEEDFIKGVQKDAFLLLVPNTPET